MSAPVVAIERLSYRRGERFRIDVPALVLHAGDAVAITGASGSGKSTLLDVLALLRAPSEAAGFALDGADVARWWREGDLAACTRWRAQRIGVVLQTGGVLPWLTVRENVLLGQRLLGRLDETHADALLARLGIAALAARSAEHISIGERQRVAVARALAHRPRLVIADEPTAALDAEHAHAVLAMLLELVRAAGSALIVASHDAPLMARHGVPIAAVSQARGRSSLAWPASRASAGGASAVHGA